jgi:hypothetical protein
MPELGFSSSAQSAADRRAHGFSVARQFVFLFSVGFDPEMRNAGFQLAAVDSAEAGEARSR